MNFTKLWRWGGRRATKAQAPERGAGSRERVAHAVFNTAETYGGRVTNVNVGGDYIVIDEGAFPNISQLLPYAEGASWDPKLACLPGTRTTVLAAIDAWAHLPDAQRIFWLKGVAGCGKSAIMHTVAQMFQREGLLVSSFFFSRDNASRNTPQTLLTTFARDLARSNASIAEEISATLEDDPALASASLLRQFEAFILKPTQHHELDQILIFVIDALDECIRDDLDTDLLAILRDGVANLPPNCRILITSRPTSNIEEFLSGSSHILTHSMDIYSTENRRDIAMYVDAQLRDSGIRSKMGPDWPDETVIQELKKLAEGLFIWIATICGYLRTVYKPREKLKTLLSKSIPERLPAEKKMDSLYSSILATCGDWDDADFVEDYHLVMGAIMAAKRPMSLTALRALHNHTHGLSPENLVQRFGSVLVGFQDPKEPIRILHVSFREFITDRAEKHASTQRFHVSEKEHSVRLAELCIKTLNLELAASIAGAGYLKMDPRVSGSPGIPKITRISEQLVYGCDHWADHIADVKNPERILSYLVPLLSHHLIAWMEITASASTFRGSSTIRLWLQEHAPELQNLYQCRSHGSALYSLAQRLSHAARFEEALLAIREAALLHRDVINDHPEAFNTDLVLSLHLLSECLRSLGQLEEALVVIQEAMDLCRSVNADQSVAFKEVLAESLRILSNCLSGIGQPEKAIAAIQEAVRLRRALAAGQPATSNADLAKSLNNLSSRLSALDRRKEALAAIQEAVRLLRALAADQPAAFKAELASSLNNLSNGLSALGRRKEALAAIEESVGLRRALAADRPAAFNADLARSLHNLSKCLSALGRREQALTAIQEALQLRRALATVRPAAFNADLARSLHNLSNSLFALGRQEEALAAIEESVHLRRELAADRPAAFNAALARALNNMSHRLSALGRQEEALIITQEVKNLQQSLSG
ncbi:hypothetical protein HWV62_44215 [Athelia sp. TMB]|nr:hypothetical protein HWV62_44215 [Athelia sp. TMB]